MLIDGANQQRRVKRAIRVLASLAVASVLATACTAGSGGASSRLSVNGLVVPAAERTVTPAVSGTTLTSEAFDIRAWRGNVVVVNFWGSWCPPCRKEAPNLQRVAEETYSRGVRFVGVDIRDSRDSAIGFERSFDVTYPSVFDPAGAQSLKFGQLAPQATPSTFVLDKQGRVAARFIGATTYAPLLATVEQVLQQG